MGDGRAKKTHEKQNGRAKVHEALDRTLVERIVYRIWMLIATVVARPWLVSRRLVPGCRASIADELKLNWSTSESVHRPTMRKVEEPHIAISLIKQGWANDPDNSHNQHRACDASTPRIKPLLLLPPRAATHTRTWH